MTLTIGNAIAINTAEDLREALGEPRDSFEVYITAMMESHWRALQSHRDALTDPRVVGNWSVEQIYKAKREGEESTLYAYIQAILAHRQEWT